MDKAAPVVSSLPFLRCIQIPPHTQRNINSSPHPGQVSQQQQNNRWDGKRHGKGAKGGIRRKKVLTGMPSLVKAAERQREWKDVSVTPRETRQRTPDGSKGHLNSKSFQTQSWQRVCWQDSTSPSGALKAERQTEVPHSVLAGVGRLMPSGHQAERLEEHGTLPHQPGIWPRRGKRTPDNTDNAKRGWVRQQEPTGSWWEGQHGEAAPIYLCCFSSTTPAP